MSLEIGLSGRSVLVTGAAGGLGRVVAAGIAEAGATVVISDLDQDSVDSCVADISSAGGRAIGVVADLSRVAEARALPGHAVEAAGSLEGLVNCAGVMQTKPMAELTEHDWARVVDINLTGVFHVTQVSANHMSAARGGSIVTLASVAARSGRPSAAHYAASKAALLSLTKSAAMAYAPRVRVNAVCPGIFLTPMWEQILAEREEAFGVGAGQTYLHETLSKVPLGRVGESQELASAVAFLLSDFASYITGQAVNVDGGLEMD